ncbi:MAG: hypothetical protein HY036_10645 [Nitrospirae bacterium]|nr:hypothetical protein [Nitrospirota bacterium]MBI3353020.1 hypothetical protein [Nitrospirota bacterium]
MVLLSSLTFLIVLGLVGCATEKSVQKGEEINLTWPLPPDPPRIKYVKTIQDAREVLPKKGFFKKAVAFIFGEEETPRLIHPYGVFASPSGKIYVSDSDLQVVHLFDFSGKVYRQVFKIPGGILRSPIGLTLDNQGNLYVADSELGRIFKFNPEGKFLKTLGGTMKRPTGIGLDPKRSVLYAVDTAEHHILALNLSGEKLFEIGKRGIGEGEFNFPTHIAVHPVSGDIFVSDSMNFRIQQFSPEGKFIRQIGSVGSQIGNFSKLKGIAVDSNGILFAVDGLYDTVQMFNSKGEFLMNFGKAGNREGEFWLPAGIAVQEGVEGEKIYVADSYNKRVQVFQLLGPVPSFNGGSK